MSEYNKLPLQKYINQRDIQRLYNQIKKYLATQLSMIEPQKEMQINPKFDRTKAKTKIYGSQDTVLSSNYYPIHLKNQMKVIYQYSIDFEPVIPDNASQISDQLIQSVKRQLGGKIGLICSKGKMVWGNQKSELSFIIKTEIQVKKQRQSYQLTFKPNTTLSFDDFIVQDQQNLIKISQVLNINIKNILKSIGFKELDKGKFYNDQDFGVEQIKQAGLSIWRGYQMNLVNVNNKLFIKADVCSRILRTQSFLETLKQTGNINDKVLMNQNFSNLSVLTRYGNHRIFRIHQIDYSMTPKSTFMNYKSQKKQTFIDYYKSVYQCSIKQANQPLIKIIVKNCQKQQVQYLIPQLVCLTGLTDDQASNFQVMKTVAQKTKLRVDQRVKQTNNIIRMVNKEGAKSLLFEIDEKAHQFPGSIIESPIITIGDNKKIEPKKGAFDLRDKIKDPIYLKEFYFVYSSRGVRDDQDADETFQFLQKASKAYGIKLSKPIFIDIKVGRGERLSTKDWINEIQAQNKNGKPQFVILYFNNQEMKDKKLYENLKKYLIHNLQLNSQVITKKTLAKGAKGALSKASKILLQINDKMGHPLYRVQKQHPFWSKNTISIGSIAVSVGQKGFIASFVGTRNNQLTQYFSDFHRIEQKQALPEAIMSNFISGWMKQYFKTEKCKLPTTLILYREGLNEKQAQKVLPQQIKVIEDALQNVKTKNEKIKDWKPKFIYILVNQKGGTRIYQMDRDRRLSNPVPGTIVGTQISKDGAYQFLMASAATTQGTCNMVQYKVAYDSSNQQIPHDAVKIITYQQCYNYPNWTGSIRFPATLQKANKLAKFVSSHGEQKISKDNPLKKLDYYI